MSNCIFSLSFPFRFILVSGLDQCFYKGCGISIITFILMLHFDDLLFSYISMQICSELQK